MMERKAKDMGQEKMLLRMYSSGTDTDNEELLDGIRDYMDKVKGPNETIETMMHEAAVFVEAFTQFKEVSIAVKGTDGLYHYVATVGFNKEAEATRKKFAMTLKEARDISIYRPVRICRASEFYLSEKKPWRPGNEVMFNRPNLLGMPRQRPDDMIEGDYVEVQIIGKDRELLGWIDASGTMNGRLPKRDIIIQMEFFASCLSLVLSHTLMTPQH